MFFVCFMCRDVALGVKADVNELLKGFSNTEGALSDLEDKLQDVNDLIDSLSSNLSLVGRTGIHFTK